MKRKRDVLFMTYNCHDCTKVKLALSNMLLDDSWRGKDGQECFTLLAFTDDAARGVLDDYGLEGVFTPCLLTWDKRVLDDPEEIIQHLSV